MEDARLVHILAVMLCLLCTTSRSSAQNAAVDDTNGDGVIDESDGTLQLPELNQAERNRKIASGFYVRPIQSRGGDHECLTIRGSKLEHYIFCVCGENGKWRGDIKLTGGWFSDGFQYWHPTQINEYDVLMDTQAWKVWNTKTRIASRGVLIRSSASSARAAMKQAITFHWLYDDDMRASISDWSALYRYARRSRISRSRGDDK